MSSRSPKRAIPVIGVTGPIGSGKSAVSACFAAWGGVIVSGDEIGHRVVDRSPQLRKRLARAFGHDILAGGQIDRRLLARRALAGPRQTATLNRIVHPALVAELNREVARLRRRRGVRAVVIDAALLVEWGIGRIHWDFLVGVNAPYELRLRRLRKRGMSLAQIRRFSRAQMPWNRKRAYCDFIVKNGSSWANLRREARLCWKKMLS